MEASDSGLFHHLGKVAYRKVPRVRISPPPQSAKKDAYASFLFTVARGGEIRKAETAKPHKVRGRAGVENARQNANV